VKEIRVIPIRGIGEVAKDDDLAGLIAEAVSGVLEDGDVLVVTHKVVSKSEGRTLPEAEKVEATLRESKRVLRRSGSMMISETHHGFICANAGIDSSNSMLGEIVLLPVDPDLSARRLRARIQHLCNVDVAVLITDTFGRPWRLGQTDVAIGVAGMSPFMDYRGTADSQDRLLLATRICVADEIAGAAEMVMGKAEGICAAIVRGARITRTRGSATEIVRPPHEDLFR
jgi:coenzyme F420-0:L-glutamate ligase / coenzyme F420-1:gamma-L-glutamate ligase